MRLNAGWWMLTTLVIAGLAVVGCAEKKTESETKEDASEATATGGEAEEHEAAGATTKAAGSVPEIWVQIGGEQTRLSAAIDNGQLKDVHHLAFGIRDLVVALADKAAASSPAVKPQLDGMVEQVTALAGNLDELGDAGNLTGSQAEYAKLDKTLKALKAMTDAR